MSTLLSVATGNFLTSTTWALVDAASLLNSETGTSTPPTSSGATSRSSAFTPAASTIDGIAVKVAGRTGTTGTITVALILSSDNSVQKSTTINMSDIPASSATQLDGGWVFFKFASGLAVNGSTAYKVDVITSSSSQITLFRDSTGNNWSRLLRTTTTQAPVAGDDMVVAGEHTGAGTGNDFTVTMDETAATDYGSATTSTVTPAMAVCKRGTLKWKDTSAANPLLRLSGHCIVYNGGTMTMGTTGTPIPRDSVAVLELDPAADGDMGLLARDNGTLTIQGLSRTSGKNIVSCKLNTDEAVASTSLGVDTDTGWLDNDQIAVASTTRTLADCELGALNGNAGASTLTVDGFAGAGGGLAVAHSGTSPTQAEVINITRNVKIRSTSSSLMAYMFCDRGSLVDIDWAEFYYLGQNSTNKRGIEIATRTAGSFNMQFSSIHDCEVGGFWTSIDSAVDSFTFSNNVLWDVGKNTGPGVNISNALTSTTWVMSTNVLIRAGSNGGFGGFQISDVGGTFTDPVAAGVNGEAVRITEPAAIITGTYSGCVGHSSSNGFTVRASGGTVSNTTIWRTSSEGSNVQDAFDVLLDGFTAFGCATAVFQHSSNGGVSGNGVIYGKNWVLSGDSTFGTSSGIAQSLNRVCEYILDNCTFGVVSGIKTAFTTGDITISNKAAPHILLRNCILASATELSGQANLASTGYVKSQKHDQTTGNHKTYLQGGTISYDTAFSNVASPSTRLTPLSATIKMESAPQYHGLGLQVGVLNGASVNISVYIRKSASGDGAAYNGNQPRLIQKANPALGQNSDVVIATYSSSTGSWNQISGTSSTATDDGIWEFVVDCDGTAGWINVDDWAVS